MENPSSTLVVFRNRDVTFREKKKLGTVAVNDDVSLLFSENCISLLLPFSVSGLLLMEVAHRNVGWVTRTGVFGKSPLW